MRTLETEEIQLFIKQRDLLRKQTKDDKALLRVAIYARKSTEDKSAASIPSQIAECKKFVSRYSYLFSQNFNHIYQDENISGLTVQRKGLQNLLDAAEREEFDVLIVYHHDRLTRSVADFKPIHNLLNKHHIYKIFGNIYCPSNATGKYIERLLFSNAEFEVEVSAERTATVLRNKARDGTSAGGSAPYGYKYSGKQFDIDENEAPAIQLIFNLVAAGESYSTICDALKQRGYKTRSGRDFAYSTISDILRNRKYKGEYVYCIHGADGHQKNIKRFRVIEGDQDEIVNKTAILNPIITAKQFDEVQRILDKHISGIPKQNAHGDYLLSGLIQCECGANVCGETTSKRNKKYRYYVCQGQRKKNGCAVKKIRAEYLENVIKQVVIRECTALLKSGCITKSTFELCENSIKTDIKNLSRIISNLEKDNKKLVSQLVGASEGVSNIIKKKIEDNIQANKINNQRLEKLNIHLANIRKLYGKTNTENLEFDFEKLFADNKRARQIIRMFVKKIIIDGKDIIVEVY